MRIIKNILEFDWDQGNINKNFIKHKVTSQECEEVFFDPRKRILKDILHSGGEGRHILLGKSKSGRLLFIVFTLRKNKIRVISARDLNEKERKLYEK